MKLRIIGLLTMMWVAAVTFAVAGKTYGVEDIPNVHVADRSRFLSNPDGLISPQAQSLADSIMSGIWQKTSAEVVAVVVGDIGDDTDPDTFATELFEKWGIGKKDKDNGLLVLIAVNQRAAVIRPGYGMEGTVPDIAAGKILRNDMFPRMREGDYDGGLLAALSTIDRLVTDPVSREELISRYGNDLRNDGDGEEMWHMYLGFCVFIGVAFLVAVLLILVTGGTAQEKYVKLSKLKLLSLVAVFISLGCALPAMLLIVWQMKRLRHTAPRCPRCSTMMQRATADVEERWLSAGQQTERRLGSVEHDVWLCPSCGYGEVKSYPNPSSVYKKCDSCGVRALHLIEDRVLRHPTYSYAGEGVRIYRCEHCGNQHHDRYAIPRKERPVVIVGGMGGRGGGGFSGGSFGGGMTGGGGASGRW